LTQWLHIWQDSIHNITVEDNWTDQPYFINKGINCPVTNTHYVGVYGAPMGWPLRAQIVKMQAGPRLHLPAAALALIPAEDS